MALVGEWREWDTETTLLANWRERRAVFPIIPSQSRFNRRRRALLTAVNIIRQTVLRMLDLSSDGQCAIDSLPVPVVKFHLAPGSRGDWAAYGADFGKVASKNMTIFGFRLPWLVSLDGLILDFALAPASAADLTIGADLLAAHTDLTVFGDRGFIRAALARQLLSDNRLNLSTLPRAHQTNQPSQTVSRTCNAIRQIIEPVNGQVTEQFHSQVKHAHPLWGGVLGYSPN